MSLGYKYYDDMIEQWSATYTALNWWFWSENKIWVQFALEQQFPMNNCFDQAPIKARVTSNFQEK